MPRPVAFVLSSLILLLAACGERRIEPGDAQPEDFIILRSYGWDSSVPQPQAEWNPEDFKVISRSVRGLMILREGHRGQSAYRTADATEVWTPQWINKYQFVYGPDPIPEKSVDGTVQKSNYGIQIGTFIEGELEPIQQLAEEGVRPVPWGRSRILAQRGDLIVAYDHDGDEELVDEGFFPAPRPDGDGLAYQTVPVFHADFWTGKPPPGDLVIRWGDGRVDILPGGVEAVWTAWGGVLATVLDRAPKAGEVWHSVPHKIVYVPEPGAEPQLVLVDGRSPRPHPTQKLLAAIDAQGQVVLMRLDGTGSRRVLSPIGERPRWSHDGERLMIEEPHESSLQQRYLSVLVFRIRGAEEPAS